jgi:hypothetical protein
VADTGGRYTWYMASQTAVAGTRLALLRPIRKRGWLIPSGMVAAVLLTSVAWMSPWHPSSIAPASHAPTVMAGSVVIEGGPILGGSDSRPAKLMPIEITGVTAGGRAFYHNLSTDKQGRFTLKLPPGRYLVRALLFSGLTTARQPHEIVTVGPGKPIHVRITAHVQ